MMRDSLHCGLKAFPEGLVAHVDAWVYLARVGLVYVAAIFKVSKLIF